jgi:cytochrome P450
MAIPSFGDRIKARLLAWGLGHQDVLLCVIRNLSFIPVPTFNGKKFAVVTRFDDVEEVLQRPNVFGVIYEPKLRLIMDGDNFFLGMNDEEPFTRDKTTMRMTAPRAEALSLVKPRVEQLARDVMSCAKGRVDIVMDLTQEVTTRFFNAYIGTVDADVKTISDQARLLFGFMFVDLANDPATRQKVIPVAAALRDYVERTIAARKANRGQHDDMLERSLKFQDLGLPGTSDREIRNNLIGIITGGLPQPPMMIPQLFDVLLDRPKELAEASAAARSGDDDLLAKYVFEASRFHPLAPALFRDCLHDYRLAGGTWRAKVIPKGARVVVVLRSAMFDGRRLGQPREFRIDRSDHDYLHFGYGMHECFGVYMNRYMVPAICKILLEKNNIRRAPGQDGRLRMDGAFPRSLIVEFD